MPDRRERLLRDAPDRTAPHRPPRRRPGQLGARLQDEYDCIYCVVDLHALTTLLEDVEDLRRNAREMVADWVAVGVDPVRSIVFRQSDVHEQHAELLALLGMATPLSWLERVPTYKGQIAELGEAIETYGFLGYPPLHGRHHPLQGDEGPGGPGSAPAPRARPRGRAPMNHLYGPVFPEPQALLAEFPLVLGPTTAR